MVVLYIAVFAAYLLLLIMSVKRGMSMWEYLYEIGNRKGIFKGEGIRDSMALLKPGSDAGRNKASEEMRRYYTGKIRLFLQMILVGNTLAFVISVSSGMGGSLVNERYITRNDYGEGSTQTSLHARITEADGRESSQNFTLVVEERRYEDMVVKQLASELKKQLPDLILGSNESLEAVKSNLILPREVQGYPFKLEWESDDYSCIDSEGCVSNEDMEEQGKVISLTAMLIYEDFREEYVIPVHIFPPQYSETELFRHRVQELLTVSEQTNRSEEQLELPEMVDGRSIAWKEKKEEGSIEVFFLLCISAAAIYVLKDRELQQQAEKRNRQLLLDYPRLVSRMTLYLGAGMTIRNVFYKIASDYQKEKAAGGEVRYVYEEMLLTCHELDSGVSELTAYEHFGKRCRLIQYMKLVNLLVQNLRKGSNSLLDAMRTEAKNAFEERKNTARKLGEEAGTKLLLPMMLMLGIVMVLIMIPAYLSFAA